ncbi:uncharacterized protein [Glycine max]|nr:uncharacterized protein LOC106798288 [Glycine max]|eukprot:XP_014629765.1 uncharacterized protein LOC106798288 [Glycine max]
MAICFLIFFLDLLDLDEEAGMIQKSTNQTDQNEDAKEQVNGNSKGKADKTLGAGKKRGRNTGGKTQAKIAKKKTPVWSIISLIALLLPQQKLLFLETSWLPSPMDLMWPLMQMPYTDYMKPNTETYNWVIQAYTRVEFYAS